LKAFAAAVPATTNLIPAAPDCEGNAPASISLGFGWKLGISRKLAAWSIRKVTASGYPVLKIMSSGGW